tara:strand:- start:228 stop:1187 length:960 start_codon:yes stop_codon:yes gene_type:complete
MTKIGFGTWAWGNKFVWNYSPNKDDVNLEKTFQTAIQGGLGLVDTADSYGIGQLNGRSEELLGAFIKKLSSKQRKSLIVATKLAPFPWRLGRAGLKNAFFASKQRLQGKIDRVQLHWSTSRYAPWQEAQLLDGLGDLWEQGLIKEIGISNYGPNRLRWIHRRLQKRGIKIKSLQIQFSLLSPLIKEQESIPSICQDLNIDLLAYSPLALGLLTKKPDSYNLPQGLGRNILFRKLLPETINLRKAINKISKERNASQMEVALNWCRSHGTIPIPGLRNTLQAKEAIRALRWKLTKEEQNYLNLACQKCKVRMPNNPFGSN